MPSKPSVKEYYEPSPPTDFDAFVTVVESRRSVRKFADEPIPDEVVRRCLELALLAPTSSNLQAWEFYRVVDPEKKRLLAGFHPTAFPGKDLYDLTASDGRNRGVGPDDEVVSATSSPRLTLAWRREWRFRLVC